MHQKEIGRICFRTDFLGYTGCHRNGRYTGRSDQRIDLSTGQFAHDLTKENTTGCTNTECNQTQKNDLQSIYVQECFCACRCTYGSTQQDNYDVHQCIGSCLCQLFYNTTLFEQVTKHQHTYQRSSCRKDHTNYDCDNDRE